MDYLLTFGIAIFDPNNFAFNANRSICFDVFIVDDDMYEDVESFNISLELGTFIAQSRITIDPSLTEIFILDNDGKIQSQVQIGCLSLSTHMYMDSY